MRILLDENFPLPLYRRLCDAGYEAEHIIPLGLRGVADSVIRSRLATETLLFVTNDIEFLERSSGQRARVIVSRVPQSLAIDRRVEVWFHALSRFLAAPPAGDVFELLPTGEVVPWTVAKS